MGFGTGCENTVFSLLLEVFVEKVRASTGEVQVWHRLSSTRY